MQAAELKSWFTAEQTALLLKCSPRSLWFHHDVLRREHAHGRVFYEPQSVYALMDKKRLYGRKRMSGPVWARPDPRPIYRPDTETPIDELRERIAEQCRRALNPFKLRRVA